MVIYKFTHIESGKVYIGQTIQDANQRRLEHLSESRNAKTTHKFHNALKKYGEDAFTFEVIASASTLDELNLLEVKYIADYNSIEEGYNLREGGDNRLHHPASIEKMRASQKAAHARRKENGVDGGWVRKDGGPMKGKVHPKKGKPSTKWSEEARARFSLNRQEYYANRSKE